MKQLTQFSMVVLFMSLLAACGNGQTNSADGSIAQNVNVEQFSSHIGTAQLVDVRTPAEWNEGIMEGAKLFNIYEDDFEKNLGTLDKEKPVAVYCKVGGRSGQAMAKMKELGFKEVYNLDGGMDAWKRAGKPTVSPK